MFQKSSESNLATEWYQSPKISVDLLRVWASSDTPFSRALAECVSSRWNRVDGGKKKKKTVRERDGE